MATRAQLFAKPKPQPEYQNFLDYVQPIMNKAVKKAEGNPNNFGVLSEQVNGPGQANQVLNKSIENSFWRWLQAGRPDKFIDFMQQRWAPRGAANDPQGLNKNWAPNVRKGILEQVGPQEYDRLKGMNFVEAAPWSVLDADPNAIEKVRLKGLDWQKTHPRSYGWNNTANV